ncbi:MAG: Methyltransferase [Verrucomicrobiales bacterium]|nr:Methyltransferase [Verrucomicrobiales bacterium]
MSHPLAHPPASDPALLLRFRDRQYSAELLAAALLHFDCFTWMKDHPGCTDGELCLEFDWIARPADVLMTLCRASGLLTTDGEGRHRLTTLGEEHFTKGSPWFLGPYFAPIRDTPIVKNFISVLTTGRPASWQAKSDTGDWHTSMLDPVFARSFTDLMNSRGITFGQHLAAALTTLLQDRHHVLDVAGGSGIYSACLTAAHPHLRATVLEQKPVDAITRTEIARHGLTNRVEVATGDMFAVEWPRTDVLLFSNVLHDWDFPEMDLLVEKAARTLPAGGLLIIHDAFIRDDKTGPLPVAEYSALLMNITQGKCYSPAEYGRCLTLHGFTPGPYQDTVADRGFMTAVKN